MNFRKEILNLIEDGKRFDLNLLEFSNEMKQNKNKIPPLYRYSPANYDNIRNFENQTIFLSNVGSMNDVFEGLSTKLDAKSNKLLEFAGDLAYLKSFTECENDLKMWGQYADSYKGMCVEYDMSKIDDILIYHLFPVTYTNTRIDNDLLKFTLRHFKKQVENESFEEFFLQDIASLFLLKPKCWENEKEWRILFSWLHLNFQAEEVPACEEDEETLYSYDKQIISFPYAKAVYMGPKMPKHIKDHILEIANKLKIPAFEMVLSESEYKLESRIYRPED